MMSKTCTTGEIQPSNTEPSSQWTDNPSDPSSPGRPPWTGEIPMEHRRGESTMEPMRIQQPRETPMDRGEIPMEHRKREFTMEPRRMSPMQPRQRQRSWKYSSKSLYSMDRTARTKATSSVATQTDSFQDPLGEISEFQDHSQQQMTIQRNLQHSCTLTHFKTLQTATFDSFQDHSEEEKRKLVQIDSFQDHHSGLHGNSSEIDSFQDPCDTSN